MQPLSTTDVHDRVDSWKPLLKRATCTGLLVSEAATQSSPESPGSRVISASYDEVALAASWRSLLPRLEEEARKASEAGLNIIPSIDFGDIKYVVC